MEELTHESPPPRGTIHTWMCAGGRTPGAAKASAKRQGANGPQVGHIAKNLIQQGRMVNDGVHIGILNRGVVPGTREAEAQTMLVADLAKQEGCGIHDRCWPLLFGAKDHPAGRLYTGMCCKPGASQHHDGGAQHTFKPATIKMVDDFRERAGVDASMDQIAKSRDEAAARREAAGGQQQQQQRRSGQAGKRSRGAGKGRGAGAKKARGLSGGR